MSGAAEIARLAKRFGFRAIARAVEVDEGAVRQWASGKTKPRARARLVLRDVYGVKLGVWDDETKGGETMARPGKARGAREKKEAREATIGKSTTTSSEAGASPSRSTDSDVEVDDGERDPVEEARASLTALKRERDRLASDPTATPKERAANAHQITAATRLLMRASGATDLTVSQILRSQHWRSVKQIVRDALRPYPEASEAVSRALREFDGTAEH